MTRLSRLTTARNFILILLFLMGAVLLASTSTAHAQNDIPLPPQDLPTEDPEAARVQCESDGKNQWFPNSSGGGTCSPKGANASDNYTGGKGASTCQTFTNFFLSPLVCTGRLVSVLTGSILIAISAAILEMVASLFNWMVYYTVIAFGDQTNGFLTKSVLDGINTAWTVFRDISNILIIGLFTFIAISIILGLKEFGQKKMIARVLIVAVLINFSLLFTKLIVDGSNFVAYQFYKASLNGQISKPGQGASVVAANSNCFDGTATGPDCSYALAQDGIAGAFVRLLGVTSSIDTRKGLDKIAEQNNNGWLALWHGIFSAIMLLGAAIVLLYGSFLLVTRAIYIVFLMVTSAIAFATFLIPKLSTEGAGEKFGWSAWWSALIKTAVFAPILMMMLWATLIIGNALVPRTQGGTLGGLLSDTSNAANWSAMFAYIIVLGMLFASFKVASSFSGSIAGFNLTAALPLNFASRIAAPALRQTAGRFFYGQSKSLASGAKDDTKAAATARVNAQLHSISGDKAKEAAAIREAHRLEQSAASKAEAAAKAGKRAASNFNFADTKVGKTVAKSLGISGALAGESDKKAKGYEGQIKDLAKHAADIAKKAGEVSTGDKKELQKILEEGVKQSRAQTQQSKDLQKSVLDATQRVAETQGAAKERDSVKRELDTSQKNLGTAEAKKTVIEASHDPIIKQLQEQIDRGDATKIPELTQAKANKQAEMERQDDRIKSARNVVSTLQSKLGQLDAKHEPLLADARAKLEQAKTELGAFTKETEDMVKGAANKAVSQTMEAIDKDIAGSEVGFIGRVARIDNHVAKAMRDKIKEDKSVSAVMKKAFKEYSDESGGHGGGGGGGAPKAASGGTSSAPAAPSGGEPAH